MGARMMTKVVRELSCFHAELEQKTASVLLHTSSKSWSVREVTMCHVLERGEAQHVLPLFLRTSLKKICCPENSFGG